MRRSQTIRPAIPSSPSSCRPAKFSQWILGIGADVSINIAHTHEHVFSFDTVGPVEFYPTDEYLERRMLAPMLKVFFLDQQHFHKKFYMINGAEVAKGAVTKSDVERTTEFAVDLGVDATPFTGVPVEVGAGD